MPTAVKWDVQQIRHPHTLVWQNKHTYSSLTLCCVIGFTGFWNKQSQTKFEVADVYRDERCLKNVCVGGGGSALGVLHAECP